jgi:peptidoglycan pentaglycine glycine transferase (the first glycine)
MADIAGMSKGNTAVCPARTSPYNALTMRVCSSVQSNLTPQQWEGWVRDSPSGHLLQSWAWGELKANFGWRPLRIAVTEGDGVLAAAQILFRPLLGNCLSTAYVPKGPVLGLGTPTSAATARLLEAVHDACLGARALSLKLEPDWEDQTEAHRWLQSQGFAPSAHTVQPRRSVVIDLTPDEDAILAQMKSKTRYNIRLAQRKGVSVRLGTEDDLAAFYGLLRMTAQRAEFGIHTREYYAQAWRLFAQQNAVALLLADYRGRTLAAIMVFALGPKAWYMYGASSDEERQRMPTYLVQWEAMRWAKERGCDSYDLWGIPDVDENEIGSDIAEAERDGVLSAGMGGLYRFKRGFGGREVRYVGAYDYVYNRPLYGLLSAAWDWRRA